MLKNCGLELQTQSTRRVIHMACLQTENPSNKTTQNCVSINRTVAMLLFADSHCICVYVSSQFCDALSLSRTLLLKRILYFPALFDIRLLHRLPCFRLSLCLSSLNSLVSTLLNTLYTTEVLCPSPFVSLKNQATCH